MNVAGGGIALRVVSLYIRDFSYHFAAGGRNKTSSNRLNLCALTAPKQQNPSCSPSTSFTWGMERQRNVSQGIFAAFRLITHILRNNSYEIA